MIDSRRTELLRRRRRDTLEELAALDSGKLWHVLSDDEYRGVLLATLEEIDEELEDHDDQRYGSIGT